MTNIAIVQTKYMHRIKITRKATGASHYVEWYEDAQECKQVLEKLKPTFDDGWTLSLESAFVEVSDVPLDRE